MNALRIGTINLILFSLMSTVTVAGEIEQRALGAFADKEYSASIALFQRARAEGDLSTEAEINFAQALLYQDRLFEAFRILDGLRKSSEQQATVLELYGDGYVLVQDWNTAQQFYEAALALLPDNATCHLKLGQVLSQKGDYTSADQHFDMYSSLAKPEQP